MRHIVFGLFNTYAEADGARNTLVQAGFAYNDVELQANPETRSDTPAVSGSPGLLANIERFLASLFSSAGPSAPEAQRYADAVRHGAVLVCVRASAEPQAELARNTLTRLGALETGERPPGWDDPWDARQTRREHSALDELGVGSQPATSAAPVARDMPPVDDPSAAAISAASAPGSGAVFAQRASGMEQNMHAAEVPPGYQLQQEPPAGYSRVGSTSAGQVPMHDVTGTPGTPGTMNESDARREQQVYRDSLAAGAAQPEPRDIGRAPAAGMPEPSRGHASAYEAPPMAYPDRSQADDIDAPGRSVAEGASGVHGADYLADTASSESHHPSRGIPSAGFPPAMDYRGDKPTDSTRRADAGMTSTDAGRRIAPNVDATTDDTGLGAPIPDEFLEYEEDFRSHYDEQYRANKGARYDEYAPAYRYGASIAHDTRFQDRPWDEVEPDARREWEQTSPEHGWERFKTAVRHGWDRVTGHQHHDV
jgi:hypothetical protein